MDRKSFKIIIIVFCFVIIIMIVGLIIMNNKLTILESEYANNNENSWEGVFSEVEISYKTDFKELKTQMEIIEIKLNELSSKLKKVEEYNQELEVLHGKIDDIRLYNLTSEEGELIDIKTMLSTLKGIVYSNKSYRILIGRAVNKISDNVFEIIKEDNTKEIIKISSECEAYAVGQSAYVKIDLKEYIEKLLFYEDENTTLIEIDGEIRYMFQGDIR